MPQDRGPSRSPAAALETRSGGAGAAPGASEYVPADIDATRWDEIEPLARGLLERPVKSAAQFEAWLLDRSELDAACGEGRATLYINMTCHTDDEAASSAWSRYIEEVPPMLRPMSFELDKRQVELAGQFPLDADRYMVLERATKADVELFRAENVPLMTEQDRLTQQYQQITGGMTVEFDGREHTLPQMGRYMQETDRAVRERAWRAVSDRRLQDKDAIDDVYDKLVALRHKIAKNAGFANFMEYSFKSMKRFDYTPAHCEAFHEAVATHVVPLVRRLDEQRRAALKVDALRPWDLAVDEKGRDPLRPFANGDELLRLSRRVFDRMGGGLGEMFAELGENGTPGDCLDLDSRKGKAPGGYQYMRDRSRRPFIFMNAAGLHRDVETMLHEAGHAFHSQLSRHEPLVAYRESPIEFAEVASMSMELLSMTEWEVFYPKEADLIRARRLQLEDHTIMILPWIAQIDAFQHWVYTNPGHTRSQRNAEWLRLDERFGHALSWQGIEDARSWQWQRQLHLFIHPFYYIEYGIARLGSMGLWLTSLEKGRDMALALYKRGLSLGGSRPLPELFEASGLPFDFGPETVKRLVDAVVQELEGLQS